ncbi:MAG TPA: hypothetical protein VH763_03070 [Gemmatimonadales bacterium]
MSKPRIAYILAALGMPALTAAMLTSAPHSVPTQISGVFTMKVAQQHALPVGDQTGPILLLTQSAGTNRSTGSSEYMDGAQVINREIADLTQGNGPHQGYVTQIKGADTSVTRWQGKVTTTLGSDQKPATSVEGTWTKVSGTGKYQGVTGAGKYKGRMLSQSEYTIEWSGEIVTQHTSSR